EALGELKVALTEHAAAAGEIAVYGLTTLVTDELERTAERHDAALARLARAEAMVAILIPMASAVASATVVASAGGGVAITAMAALAAAAAGEAL
ncbi:hypothetical protein SMA37_25970, partial [Escherichia coli]|uniref:hypothetical protein n=1 Tax=Escherichia coli TaxID=562 RepID=UPI00307959D6